LRLGTLGRGRGWASIARRRDLDADWLPMASCRDEMYKYSMYSVDGQKLMDRIAVIVIVIVIAGGTLLLLLLLLLFCCCCCYCCSCCLYSQSV
jgi:hypothetical protein